MLPAKIDMVMLEPTAIADSKRLGASRTNARMLTLPGRIAHL